jgi:hypothetical protein
MACDADERIVKALRRKLAKDGCRVQPKGVAFRIVIRDVLVVIEQSMGRCICDVVEKAEVRAIPTQGMRLAEGAGDILGAIVTSLCDDIAEVLVEVRNVREIVEENALVVPVVAIAHEGDPNVCVGVLGLHVLNDIQHLMASGANPGFHRRRAIHDEAELDREDVHPSR